MSLYYTPGRYRCRVESQGWAEAKKSGRPMIVLEVRPLAQLFQGAEGPEENYVNGQYTRTIRVVVNADSEKQMDFALRKLRHAGFTGESFADMNLQGQEVECQCDPGEYEGKENEQWDLALPPLEMTPATPLDDKATRKLDTLFGKRLKNGTSQKQAPKGPIASAIAQATQDDEVPF